MPINTTDNTRSTKKVRNLEEINDSNEFLTGASTILPFNATDNTRSTEKGRNLEKIYDSNEFLTGASIAQNKENTVLDNVDEAGSDYRDENKMTKEDLIALKQKLGIHLEKNK